MTFSSTIGRVLFGAAVVGSGALQLARQSVVRLVPALPGWVGAPRAWALASGIVLVVAGVALVLNRSTRTAAVAVGVLLAVTFALYVPSIAANPGAGYVWTNPAKVLALIGGCLLLGWPAVPDSRTGLSLRSASALMALFLIIGGVQHGVYVDFVTTLVPEWLPARRGWAWFTGGALLAGGIGLLLPQTRRWAAIASGAMIFSWVWLLHVPRAIAHPGDAGEIAGACEALALSAVCWLVAAASSLTKSRALGQ